MHAKPRASAPCATDPREIGRVCAIRAQRAGEAGPLIDAAAGAMRCGPHLALRDDAGYPEANMTREKTNHDHPSHRSSAARGLSQSTPRVPGRTGRCTRRVHRRAGACMPSSSRRSSASLRGREPRGRWRRRRPHRTATGSASPRSAICASTRRYARLAYDPVKDLAPVGVAWDLPNVAVVAAEKNPAKTLAEFITWAKANGITYGSPGVAPRRTCRARCSARAPASRAPMSRSVAPRRRCPPSCQGDVDFTTWPPTCGSSPVGRCAPSASRLPPPRWPTMPPTSGPWPRPVCRISC